MGIGLEPKSSKCLLNELIHFSNHIKVLFSLSSGQINQSHTLQKNIDNLAFAYPTGRDRAPL